jgi:pimeloyl-ACP methyl ester carboxylesterase
MNKPAAQRREHHRNHVEDLRGATRLAVEATRGVMGLVQAMHRTIASGPAVLGKPLEGPASLLTGLVYGGISGVTKLVGAGIDGALAPLGRFLGESAPGPEREAVLAALNGVLGDYLQSSNNPLAIPMRLRRAGLPLELEKERLREAIPAATSRVVVLVHGSSMNDRQWLREGHDHGASLAGDLGFTALYLHYNSGLHISESGSAFAGLLEQLVQAWPVTLDELVLLGHSMGGLVARSAVHAGEVRGHRWRSKLRKLVTLGSPHHGAPLERGGNRVDRLLGVSAYSAPFARLGKIRSAGVTDLRHGTVRDEDWRGRDRFEHGADHRTPLPLPEGVSCYAVAASTAIAAPVERGSGEMPRDERRPGDGLVPIDSALGRHPSAELNLAFPEAHQWVVLGINHFDLLSSLEVYGAVRRWLTC